VLKKGTAFFQLPQKIVNMALPGLPPGSGPPVSEKILITGLPATFRGEIGQNIDMRVMEAETLGELCLRAAAAYKKKRAFEIFRDGKVYDLVSYGEWGLRSRQFASLLGALGVKPGGRVMILAENCPEWPISYFGTALADAVSVPVLIDFSGEQIQNIAGHAEVSAICVTERTAPKCAGIDPAIPRIFIDTYEEAPLRVKKRGRSMDDIAESAEIRVSLGGTLRRLSLENRKSILPRREAGDLASIIYTSGTAGNSKGVMLSHRNLLFCAGASRKLMRIYPRDRLLSVIPLAHAYECTVGLLTAVMNGASITYLDKPPSPAVLLPAIQALRPTAMVTVPLFIEKIYRQKIAPALEASPLYRCPLTRPLALALAGRRLMAAFGGSIRFFGLGGAPLAADVEEFLRKVKFPYAPGYGLTETAPLLTGTAPYRFPGRSVGSVVPGVEIRIADGEIQARGPNVMMGYYRDEEGTREAFSPDGWLKTGDLGELDSRGRLYVRGRLKALILGPSGENIYPEEIEGLLNASGMVEDALVCPGEKGEIVALVVLNKKARAMINAAGEALEELKKKVNQQLASFSRLSRIEVKDEPFEKTPTHKIKRFLYGIQKPLDPKADPATGLPPGGSLFPGTSPGSA
jgi:long-chain acyl-CoA synthetase